MYYYVAFLRAISPLDPRMRNAALAAHFKAAGFHDVTAFLTSGNFILATAERKTPKAVADAIDRILVEKVGIPAATAVYSAQQLRRICGRQPFGDKAHSPRTYLIVTCFTKPPRNSVVSARALRGALEVLRYDPITRVLYTVVDQTKGNASDFMRWLEKQYGKDITTRTWRTVLRAKALLDKTNKHT